jgi:hypothetical protein
MSNPAFIEIDGKRLLWCDLVKRRREQLAGAQKAVQPALFELRATPARRPSAPLRGVIWSRRCSRFSTCRADRPVPICLTRICIERNTNIRILILRPPNPTTITYTSLDDA